MLFVLSPAKSLDFEPAAPTVPHTEPLFVKQSAKLIKVLKTKTPLDVSKLMDLSDNLAAVNVARYQAWSSKFSASNAKQAVLAFDGDVYDGLVAKTLKPTQLAWAQDRVCILSGLYGVLRPLDWMQPYRLEMGTSLATDGGKNLYQFWGSQLADYLNTRLVADRTPLVVNLASQEYFKAVDLKVLKARVIDCVFEDWKSGQFKIISFFAKRARGLMARYAIEHKVGTPAGLKKFDVDGYRFVPEVSTPDRLVFRRKIAP
jgi:cytoplasmic iron level regulating protein YaaA (DUF328/UPF0246 family)